MKRKFNGKKRKNVKNNIFKFIVVIIMTIIFISFCLQLTIFNSSANFIKFIMDESLNVNVYDKYTSISKKMLSFINDVNNPITLLEQNFNYKDTSLIYNDIYDGSEYEKMTAYLAPTKELNIEEPLVYIYNTHPLETYIDEALSSTDLSPNVMAASYLLQDVFLELGIPAIVETNDITAYLKENNWAYSKSYNASRIYLLEAIEKYSTLELFIDIHRDAISHANSTTTIDGLECAKIMFVVGMDHDNFQENLDYANYLNELITSVYPTLTRGVMKQTGASVNGIYNQDITTPMVLIELGGYENTIEEVSNTINLIASFLIGDL